MSEAHRSDPVVRPVTADDFEQTLALGLEAFGDLPEGMTRPTAEGFPGPGRHSWGAFEGGRLLGRAVGREYHSWWHGAEIPTCGVAGVTVAAEERGAGLLDAIFRPLLAEAMERGEVLSTLYPTAPGVYRRFGYELVGALETVELPTAELQGVRPPIGVRTRRGTLEDVPAIRDLYTAWAQEQNGPLTRRGVSFTATDQELLDDATVLTVAADEADRVVGYLMWTRGRGYGREGRLTVEDTVAVTVDAHRALWRMVATFAPVTPGVRLTTSGADLLRAILPSASWQVVEARPYMLRLLDVEAAFSLLRAGALRGEVAFEVAGDEYCGTDGAYVVRVSPAGVACQRVDLASSPERPVFTPGGLALAWSGVQTCANLRMAGLLKGGAGSDVLLDRLLRGRPVHIRDYF
ncbi:GNAT family N-acetyltransferase [Nocardioides bizhenqiangii]|uniref:GNAT family N-acetyltransferase n=1 Tax=Nocardioides bizhenqiangii TaxID=3095076 RepID=A0ABZ0ZLF6_9ACTN|nr:GNAT family N-acetyltransferase [Nocardioides sp. HM61]WQQ24786.1 GNAT family N-acetyltransferase [Nocardioides sp. HM61]